MIDTMDGQSQMHLLFDERIRPALTMIVLVVSLLLGGSAVPGLMLIVELVALPLLVLALALPAPQGTLARYAGWLCMAMAILVLTQLIPLPDGWSRALPGRDAATAIRDAAGLRGPFPLSLDPQATLGSGLALIPGVSILLSCLRASSAELTRLTAAFVALASASALLGVYQVATGGPYFFNYAHIGQSTGIFANRNHQGAFILCAMLIATVVARSWGATFRSSMVVAGLIVMLALCAVLTTSRATLLLLPVTLGCALPLLLVRFRLSRGRIALAAFLGVALFAGAMRLPVVAPVVDRLASATSDGRFGYWEDTFVAMRAMWPAGAGFGTFPMVYPSVENLDTVERYRVNHAHNEVIELLMEGGVAALLLLLAWIGLIAVASLRALHSEDPRAAGAALAAIGVVSIFSLSEFPLRNFAVEIGFAVAHAVLLRAGDRKL